jgi:hypothetical protein
LKNPLQEHYLEKPITRKGVGGSGGVAQGEDPEFKSHYQKKKKGEHQNHTRKIALIMRPQQSSLSSDCISLTII